MIEEIDKILQKYNVEQVVIEEVIPEDVKGNNTVFKALIYLQAFIAHKLNQYNLTPKFLVSSE